MNLVWCYLWCTISMKRMFCLLCVEEKESKIFNKHAKTFTVNITEYYSATHFMLS